ncbi:MAG: SPOCS domain-containing protein [Peptococcia bacterium]
MADMNDNNRMGNHMDIMGEMAGMAPSDINITTRRLQVESVVGDATRQVNVVRTITLPVFEENQLLARKVESVDTEIRGVEYKIIDDKVIVEATLHKQIYYVECVTGDVQEFTVPDEKITEFVHIEGARPGMEARVNVAIEFCDLEAIKIPGQQCFRQFQQTCILKIRVRIVEMVEVDVVTNVSGPGITPTFQTITIDNVIGKGCQQHTISDTIIDLDDIPEGQRAYKIKNVDAVIRNTETKVLPNKVVVKGILHKQIFYVVTPVGEVREFSIDVPFSVFVEVPGARPGVNISTDIRIEYVDAKIVSGNKIKETVVLEICATASESITINVVTAVSGAHVETRTLKVQSSVGQNCRQVNILADLTSPEQARKVARVDATLRNLTAEVIPNKVIVKGMLHKQIFYVSQSSDHLREFSVDEPFTEFVHVDGAQPGDTVDVTGRIEFVNVEAAAHLPTNRFRQTAVLEICANVTETRTITVVVAVTPIGPEPQPICPPGTTFSYTIQKGDTLFSIAQANNTTVQAILAVNPQITNPNIIFVGRTIQVPCPGGMG